MADRRRGTPLTAVARATARVAAANTQLELAIVRASKAGFTTREIAKTTHFQHDKVARIIRRANGETAKS
jgi:hypothetical protein